MRGGRRDLEREPDLPAGLSGTGSPSEGPRGGFTAPPANPPSAAVNPGSSSARALSPLATGARTQELLESDYVRQRQLLQWTFAAAPRHPALYALVNRIVREVPAQPPT